MVVIASLLYGRLGLRIKLTDIPGRVDFCQVNGILVYEDTLPHYLFGLLHIDGQAMLWAINDPHTVFNFDLVKKITVQDNLRETIPPLPISIQIEVYIELHTEINT